MKTFEGSADYAGGRNTTISEADLNGEPKDLDEADMIRMGKLQQTRVDAMYHHHRMISC